MSKAKTLRDRCIAEAPNPNRGKWESKLDPGFLAELTGLVLEWSAGGEIRKCYPTLTQLCNWLATLDSIPVGHFSVIRFAKEVIKHAKS